jgi:uncharacterized small protein (DUF1192 family)
LDESFVIATPEVLVSNAKKVKELSDRISSMQTELSFVKSERDRYQKACEAFTQTQEI